jgi:hypothetical protein
MLFLMLGVFRAMPAAEPPRCRHALAVFVLAFFLLGHLLVSLRQSKSLQMHFSDDPTFSLKLAFIAISTERQPA